MADHADQQLETESEPAHSIVDSPTKHVRATDDAYLAGFRDCRCQVISYQQQQQHLERSVSHDDVTSDVMLDDELVESLTQHLLNIEYRLQPSSAASSITNPRTDARCFDACAVDLPEVGPSFDDSALGNSFVEVSATEEMSVVDLQPEAEVLSSLSENANVLMRLARENPHVGRLLDDLFELMDSEDDDVYDSDAESDEGVHEMNGELYYNNMTSHDDVCST